MRVCCVSFQKFAMCVRERNVAPAFKIAAPTRYMGVWRAGTKTKVVDVRKDKMSLIACQSNDGLEGRVSGRFLSLLLLSH
jgi:hypothetical protein